MKKIALYTYLPLRYQIKGQRRMTSANDVRFEENDLARHIVDFKDGRNYAKRWAAKVVCKALSNMNLTNTILICIPASSHHANVRRYKKFSQMVCQALNMVNGFDWVQVNGKRQKAHTNHVHALSENMGEYVTFTQSLAGKKVLVFDDITTTSKTADAFIAYLTNMGAEVKMAFFLAKTKNYKFN